MAQPSKFGFDKLGDSNYATWRVQMKGLLATKDCLGAITDQNDPNRVKAMGLMIMCVEEQHLATIEQAASTADAWAALEALYQQTSTANLLQLRKQLTTLEKKANESIQQYVARARSIADQIRAATNTAVNAADLVLAVLAGLPSEYNMVRTVVENMAALPNLAELQAKLLMVEKQQPELDGDTAFYTRVDPARKPGKFRKQDDRQAGYQQAKGRSNKSKPNTCHYCGKRGHFIRECRFRIADEGGTSYQSKRPQRPEIGLMATDVSDSSSALSNPNTWALDSGATKHITPNKGLLVQPKTVQENIPITWGNGTAGKAQAVGDVILMDTCAAGRKLVLRDVLYVPEAKANLLSMSHARKAGARFVIDQHGCKVYYGPDLLATAKERDGLYIIESQGAKPARAMLAQPKETAQEWHRRWHRRFGHLGYENLAKMVKGNMVKGINLSAEDFLEANKEVCEPCALAKQTRLPFQSSSTKADQPLTLVHSDVCGPMKVASLGGKRYIATFLDDYSGLSAIRLMKHKSEVAPAMKEVFTMLENQSAYKVKALRTDNGGEYVNSEVSTYLKSKGVFHQKTMAYTPEQNGKAERLNRTLIEKVRAMLADAGLSKQLWAEALLTANMIRNRSPVADKDKTPWELFFGEKPDVSFLRTYGSKAYVLVPKEKRNNKLDAVSTSGKLVGYAPGCNGYRILIGNHKIISSRDVVFSSPNSNSAAPLPVEEEDGNSGQREQSTAAADEDEGEDDDDDPPHSSSNSNNSSANPAPGPGPSSEPPPAPLRRSTRVTAGRVNPYRYVGSSQYPGYDRMPAPANNDDSATQGATVMLATIKEPESYDEALAC